MEVKKVGFIGGFGFGYVLEGENVSDICWWVVVVCVWGFCGVDRVDSIE